MQAVLDTAPLACGARAPDSLVLMVCSLHSTLMRRLHLPCAVYMSLPRQAAEQRWCNPGGISDRSGWHAAGDGGGLLAGGTPPGAGRMEGGGSPVCLLHRRVRSMIVWIWLRRSSTLHGQTDKRALQTQCSDPCHVPSRFAARSTLQLCLRRWPWRLGRLLLVQ